MLGLFAKPIAILNIFTLSNYAPFYQGDHDVVSVSRTIAFEDDSFAQELGLAHLDLGLRDNLLRWNLRQDTFPLLHTSSLVIGWPTPGSRLVKKVNRQIRKLPRYNKEAFLQKIARFDRTYELVKREISNLFSKCPNATVVLPLCIGSHSDHVIVACACEDAKSKGLSMTFYEDLPYAWRYTMRDISSHASQFNNTLVPLLIDIGPVLNAKIANLSLYRSQLGSREIGSVIKHSRRPGHSGVFERLWGRPAQ